MSNCRQRLGNNKNFVTVSVLSKKEELNFQLTLRQQPQHCRILIPGEKVERRPLEPAPIIQLSTTSKKDGSLAKDHLSSPHLFMKATLEIIELSSPLDGSSKNSINSPSLIFGSMVSSLQLVKDFDKTEVGMFVFPNISIKAEGVFKLHFDLFEMNGEQIVKLGRISGEVFRVSSAEKFPGWEPTTPLTHLLSSQGVKVNLRKRNHVTLHSSSSPSSPSQLAKKLEKKSSTTSQKKSSSSSSSTTTTTTQQTQQQQQQQQPTLQMPTVISNSSNFIVAPSAKRVKIAPNNFPSTIPLALFYQQLSLPLPLHFQPTSTLLASKPLATATTNQVIAPKPIVNIANSTPPSSPSSASSPSSVQPPQLSHAEMLLSLGTGSSTQQKHKISTSQQKQQQQQTQLASGSQKLPSFFELVNSLPL